MMKKKIIYTISALLCSIASITGYKKFVKNKESFVYNDKIYENINIAKNINTNLVGSAGVPDFTIIAAKAVNAAVSVKNYSNKIENGIQDFDPFDFFFGFPEDFKYEKKYSEKNNIPKTTGSGVIISPKGYIVTNNHVIEDADKIEIKLNNHKTYKAKLIGTDPNTDIALLKIEEKHDLPFIYFSNSDNVKVGEWVLAIGNPFGLNSTITAGIISAKSRTLGILGKEGNMPLESFVQTDAAINPGNSGGALLNTKGELIGINTAIHSRTGSYEGYGFAIPCNLVEKIVKDLKQYGVVQRAFLGIQGIDLSDEEILIEYNEKNNKNIKSQQGVMIIQVNKKSAAENANIKKEDIIKEIDGIKIQNFADLSGIIGRKKPGDKILIKLYRKNKEKKCLVTLRDIHGRTKIRQKEEISILEWLGVKLKPLDNLYKKKFGINYGLKVLKIKKGTLYNIGLQEGDLIILINGKKLNKTSDVDNILKGYSGDVYVKYIKKNGQIIIRGFEMN